MSDETVRKLEEAAKELTSINYPPSHELIENEVCNIKDRIAKLLNLVFEKFQQIQRYDKKMKNMYGKIKNVNDLLDKIQISTTDAAQVRYYLLLLFGIGI